MSQDLTLLVADLKKNDRYTRLMALELLGEIGPSAISALPDVAQVINDTDAKVCAMACSTFGKIGTIGHEVNLMAELNLMSNPEFDKFLVQSNGVVEKNIQPLADALQNEDEGVRKVALSAFCVIGSCIRYFITDISYLLSDDSDDVRMGAAHALSVAKDLPEATMSLLIFALNDQNTDVCLAVLEAICQAGASANMAVPSLLEMLKRSEVSLLPDVILTLGSIGVASSDVASRISDFLIHYNSDVRVATKTSLRKMDISTNPVFFNPN